jgi:hypothetical protein
MLGHSYKTNGFQLVYCSFCKSEAAIGVSNMALEYLLFLGINLKTCILIGAIWEWQHQLARSASTLNVNGLGFFA